MVCFAVINHRGHRRHRVVNYEKFKEIIASQDLPPQKTRKARKNDL